MHSSHIGQLGSKEHIAGAALIGFGYVANFFAAAWSPDQAHYLMHLWSLSQEEQYYVLLAPLLLFVTVHGRGKAILYGITILVVLVTTERGSFCSLALHPDQLRSGHEPRLALGRLRRGLPLDANQRAGARPRGRPVETLANESASS
jgi:peptidoglycan/LPS O-acetylase OafA/YrhL